MYSRKKYIRSIKTYETLQTNKKVKILMVKGSKNTIHLRKMKKQKQVIAFTQNYDM